MLHLLSLAPLRSAVIACATCAEAHGSYDPKLVALSIVVAIVASYTALDLGGRVATNTDLARRAWLVAGAVMMGIGIWSMHFVGMLAFIMPMSVTYEPGLTAASVLVAMGASGLALFLVSRNILTARRLIWGGLVMGTGIAGMHYIGMAAMQMQAKILYNPALVALSEIIAVAASAAALALAYYLRREDQPRFISKAIGAVLMGAAIAGMHYTGMASARFELTSDERLGELPGLEIGQLGATAIGGGTLLALGLTLLTSLVDLERRRGQQTLQFLGEASVRLGQLDQPPVLLTRAAELAVTRLCDWCAVDLINGTGQERIALATSRPGSSEPATFVVPTTSPALRGQSELVVEASDALLAEHGETESFRRFVRHEQIRSYLRVPILNDESTVGVITFLARAPRKFGQGDVDVALDYARRVAVALRAAELYRQAAVAVHLRDEFLSVASHELRTPLTSLQLQIETLLRAARRNADQPGAKLEPKLDLAQRSAHRMGRLVDELLDVSRISAGKLQLQREPFDLAELTRSVVEQHREQIVSSGASIQVDAQPSPGEWDRFRVEQVLTNLLTNAVKYGDQRPIAVRVRPDGAVAILEVEDHGIGISPEKQPTIFDRFERAVSAQSYSGLGLGLYITRQIVEAHGGTIELRSQPGEGSTFIVRLPTQAPRV